MRLGRILLRLSCVAILPAGLAGQTSPQDLIGVWQVDSPDGPQEILIRPDSSAAFGEESVRWRMEADTIFILFGDEWIGYGFELDGNELTLSGGDLEEPVTMTRIKEAPANRREPPDLPPGRDGSSPWSLPTS